MHMCALYMYVHNYVFMHISYYCFCLACFKNELNIVNDAVTTLNTFCDYQQTVNPVGDNNPLHFDYAILITRSVIIQLLLNSYNYLLQLLNFLLRSRVDVKV